jgi:hypothetical protein
LAAGFQLILSLLPTFAIQIAAAFVTFIETIAAAAPRLRVAFTTIFEEFIGTVQDSIPVIMELVLELMNAFYTVIMDYIPKIRDIILEVLDALYQVIMDYIPKVADILTLLIEEAINVLVDSADAWANGVAKMMGNILDTIDDNLEPFIEKGTDILVNLIEGMGKTAQRVTRAIGEALYNFASFILQWLQRGGFDEFIDIGIEIGAKIAEGVGRGLTRSPVKTGKGFLSGVVKGIKENVQDIPGVPGGDDERGLPGKVKPRRTPGFIQGEKVAKNLFDIMETFAKPKVQRNIVKTIEAVGNAMLRSINTMAQGVKAAFPAARTARRTDVAADRAQAYVDSLNIAANQVPKGAKREQLKRRAERAQARADRLRARADAADAALQRRLDFERGSNREKGDIRAEDALNLTDRSQMLLARADAEAERAKELMKTNRKAGRAMLEKARKDAAEARRLAGLAEKAYNDAQKYYVAEVNTRIEALQKERDEDKKRREEEKAFEEATTQGKIDILTRRADEADKAQKAANDLADDLIAQAQKVAASAPDQAADLLDQAEEQVALAQQAADDAEQARKDIEDLRNGGNSGTGADSSPITPSKQVLEEAAKVVDSYTASQQQAVDAAAGGQTVLQFNQTNNSPEALSVAEIYRLSNNLVSAAAAQFDS